MNASALRILKPGPLATVQDCGRKGFMAWGVPESGAADGFSLRAANLLAGNSETSAAIEITLGGFKAEFSRASIIALYGGLCKANLNGEPIRAGEALRAEAGAVLEIGMITRGARVYLAARGGIDVPEVLGSRATYLKAGLGGYLGRALKAGDELDWGRFEDGIRLLKAKDGAEPPSLERLDDGTCLLRVIPGTMPERFEEGGLRKLTEGEYTVSQECDRMGIRLAGPSIGHTRGADILSGGIEPGAVQVPGAGSPIILMADRQTTGGYTKICSVISADRPKLGQLRPSDRVRFSMVDVMKAHEEHLRQERMLRGLCTPAAPARRFSLTIGAETFAVEVEEL